LNLPQKVFLKGFYPQNISQEFSLSAFEKEDVILATGKFRVVECINENDEKIPALKNLLNDLVRFNIDPSDIPKFPIIINMTAVVQEPPITKNDDVLMTVILTNHMDQGETVIEIDCYYLASAPHLARMTPTIKKNSVLFICGEFILHDNKNYVYIKNMSFQGIQKPLIDINVSTVPWENPTSNETRKPVSIAETLAAKFGDKVKNKKPSFSITSPAITSPAITSSTITSPAITSSTIKSSSAIKTSTMLKPFSVTAKPYTRTRNRRKLANMAKDILTNSNESDVLPSTSNDTQPE
ncbi:10480_t:CDS:2, partial [Cetraspora pellucida]